MNVSARSAQFQQGTATIYTTFNLFLGTFPSITDATAKSVETRPPLVFASTSTAISGISVRVMLPPDVRKLHALCGCVLIFAWMEPPEVLADTFLLMPPNQILPPEGPDICASATVHTLDAAA